MGIELWIGGIVALAAVGAIVAVRLRGSRRRSGGEAKSIYPLW
jgi:hypothetical protein